MNGRVEIQGATAHLCCKGSANAIFVFCGVIATRAGREDITDAALVALLHLDAKLAS